MSYLLSGELHRLEDIAWKPYLLLSRFPAEFKPTCDAVLSMIGTLRLVQKATDSHQLSFIEERDLQNVLGICSTSLMSLQAELGKLPSNEGNSNAVNSVRTHLLERTKELSSFLGVIRKHSQDALSLALQEIRTVDSSDFQNSIESDWGVLTSELAKLGCAVSVVDEEFFFIEQWLKTHRYEIAQKTKQISRNSTVHMKTHRTTEDYRPYSTSVTEGHNFTPVVDRRPSSTALPPPGNVEGSDGLILQSPAQAAKNSVRRKPIRSGVASSPSLASSRASNSSHPIYQTFDTPNTTYSDMAHDHDPEYKMARPQPDLENGLMVRTPSTHDSGMILQSSVQTFEDGLELQDNLPFLPRPINIDGLILVTDQFKEYTEVAINDEACRLLVEQERNPQSCPRANLWLPTHLQYVYEGADADYIIPRMDQKSFSVMAYQTAPKLGKDIIRLKHLLNSSYSSGRMGSKDGVVSDAFRALDTLELPLPKFNFLRSSSPGTDLVELDVLDFECSTIGITNSPELFPKLEMDLAQESYWGLLSHVMGLIQAITDIFQGRAYITRSRHELEVLWERHKVSAHIAWIHAQLADWDKVENAVRFCRHWHSQQLNLQDQAIKVLKDWKSAQKILMGGEGIDIIELTVISAEDLPKYTFSRPSTFAKINFYKRNARNTVAGAELSLELSTQAAPPGRIAIWDKNLKLDVTRNAKWIDIELHQNMTGGNEKLGHARLTFLFPAGGEPTFMNRSLMYGIEETISVKIACKQNKGGEPVVLNLGVKWQGRYDQVEKAGWPTSPPGKMFRTDISGIPIVKDASPDPNAAARGIGAVPPPYNAHSARLAAGVLGRSGNVNGVLNAFR